MLKNIVILKPTDEVIYTEFFTAPDHNNFLIFSHNKKTLQRKFSLILNQF